MVRIHIPSFVLPLKRHLPLIIIIATNHCFGLQCNSILLNAMFIYPCMESGLLMAIAEVWVLSLDYFVCVTDLHTSPIF